MMSDFENERDNATPEELTLGEETDKSLVEKVKDIFVVVKVTVISYLMFQAILDRRSKIGRFDRVSNSIPAVLSHTTQVAQREWVCHEGYGKDL